MGSLGNILRRAFEAAAVTLLGALAGYWLEVFLPSGMHGTTEGHRVMVLERSIWWAALAAVAYFCFRSLEIHQCQTARGPSER